MDGRHEGRGEIISGVEGNVGWKRMGGWRWFIGIMTGRRSVERRVLMGFREVVWMEDEYR